MSTEITVMPKQFKTESMSTEITVMPKQFEEVVKNNTISDLSKAQRIASGYVPFMNEAQALAERLKLLKKGNVEDCKEAKKIRNEVGKLCSRKDELKKLDKALILVESKFIDSLANTVEGFARLTQQEAKEIEDHFENIEKERLDALQIERVQLIQDYIENAVQMDFSSMEDEVFDAYLSTKRKQHEDFLEFQAAQALLQKEKIERDRLENERVKAEAEHKAKILRQRNDDLRPYISLIRDYNSVLVLSDEEFKQEVETLRLTAIAQSDYENKQRLQKEQSAKLEREAMELKIKNTQESLAKAQATLLVVQSQKPHIEPELKKEELLIETQYDTEIDWSKITKNQQVVVLLKQLTNIEDEIRSLDKEAMIAYRLEMLEH